MSLATHITATPTGFGDWECDDCDPEVIVIADDLWGEGKPSLEREKVYWDMLVEAFGAQRALELYRLSEYHRDGHTWD